MSCARSLGTPSVARSVRTTIRSLHPIRAIVWDPSVSSAMTMLLFASCVAMGVPLDRFPVPVGGLGDQTLVSQRFRWTYGGLKGINYGAFSFD